MAQAEHELLLRQLEDACRAGAHRPSFLGFLDEHEAAVCGQALTSRHREPTWLFWGGHEQAQRVMLGFFPDYLEPERAAFPITPVTFSFRLADSPGHRDFLGSFMGLGIRRGVVGDILIGPGQCVAFFKADMAPYILDKVKKVGRVGVKGSLGAQLPLPGEQRFREIKGVVASPRLDCLTALLARTSREKAAGLIKEGLVQQNHLECLSPSARVAEGDTLSIRGQGKFIIDRLGPQTQKGRMQAVCRKYE